MTLQAQYPSNKLLLTKGGALCNPTRQQVPKHLATALICTAVSHQMVWQDDAILLADNVIDLTRRWLE
jgi:hypothetical protein